MRDDTVDMVGIVWEIWDKFLSGKSKASIARDFNIQRNEVTAIIRFTSIEMYDFYFGLTDKDFFKKVEKVEKENQKLELEVQELVQKRKDTVEKGNLIIRQKNVAIKELKEELEELKETKLSLFGKKIL